MAPARVILAEAVQFVPIIAFASSFVVHGSVDLDEAPNLFVIAAALAIGISIILAAIKARFNPILVGANVWLLLGAVGFGVPVQPLAQQLGQLGALGLFSSMAACGIVLTAASRTGYIGARDLDRRATVKLSAFLLAMTAVAMAWSFRFPDNIQVGGALPFIVLNIVRRLLLRWSRPAVAA